jgi:hypothetical protein
MPGSARSIWATICSLASRSDANGKVTYRNSFITDLDVRRENVAELARRRPGQMED